MKYSILLSCALLSIYSTYGAGTSFLLEEDASRSGSAASATQVQRYRHNPYSLDNSKTFLKSTALESNTQSTTSLLDANASRSVVTEPVASVSVASTNETFQFNAKIAQLKDCLQNSDLYFTAISHIEKIMPSLVSDAERNVLFSTLQNFGNARTTKLRDTKADRNGVLLNEYNATSFLFYQLIQSGLFSPSDTDKLRCYLVTLLIGKAFVSGRMGENEHKIKGLA